MLQFHLLSLSLFLLFPPKSFRQTGIAFSFNDLILSLFSLGFFCLKSVAGVHLFIYNKTWRTYKQYIDAADTKNERSRSKLAKAKELNVIGSKKTTSKKESVDGKMVLCGWNNWQNGISNNSVIEAFASQLFSFAIFLAFLWKPRKNNTLYIPSCDLSISVIALNSDLKFYLLIKVCGRIAAADKRYQYFRSHALKRTTIYCFLWHMCHDIH